MTAEDGGRNTEWTPSSIILDSVKVETIVIDDSVTIVETVNV